MSQWCALLGGLFLATVLTIPSHFATLPIFSTLPSPTFNDHFCYSIFYFKESFLFSECSFHIIYSCFMFGILFLLPLRIYIIVVLIFFSQHSLFLLICCCLSVSIPSTTILGHLLIFEWDTSQLTERV